MFLLNSKSRQVRAGFTLIELLVTIAIIGIIATLAIISLSGSRFKAEDSKRLANLRSLSTALELYYANNNEYPSSLTVGEPLIDSNDNIYLSSVPSTAWSGGSGYSEEYGYASGGGEYALFTYLSQDGPYLQSARGNFKPIHWFNFEEQTASITSLGTVGGNTKLWYGSGPRYGQGKVGNYAASFNGTNDYLHGGAQAPTLTEVTLTAWIYPTDVASLRNVVGGQYNPSNTFRYPAVSGGAFQVYSGSAWWSTGASTVAANQWYHVAITSHLVTRELKAYLNGVLRVNGITPTYSGGYVPAYIGTLDGTLRMFQGRIDDVQIYDSILSEIEIRAIYEAAQ